MVVRDRGDAHAKRIRSNCGQMRRDQCLESREHPGYPETSQEETEPPCQTEACRQDRPKTSCKEEIHSKALMVLALLTLPGELTIHRAKNDGRCGTLLQRTQIIRRFAEFLYYLRIAEVARGRISPPAECHSGSEQPMRSTRG